MKLADLPTSGRLAPPTTADTAFFWDAAAEGRLVVQGCGGCGRLRHPPGPVCPHCHSLDWEPRQMSGRATLSGYTVVHHPPAPGFDGPALVAVVELAEGVRLVTNVEAADSDELSVGDPLEVFFLKQAEGWTAPQFRPATTA
jgi:uncharacterized OB-fold protein